jgi:DNA-binding IclR family transcriptional regulator
MMAGKTRLNQSGEKVLQVLNVLMRNFAHGMTPSELMKATGLSASNITGYVNTLESAGFAERIPETGRIRPSHRLAQHAVAIMRSLNDAKSRAEESISRITKEI